MLYLLKVVCLSSLLIIVFSACSPTATPTLPVVTPIPLSLQIDPGLAGIVPAVAACQSNLENAALFTELGINLQNDPELIIGYAKNTELPHQFLLGRDLLVLASSAAQNNDLPDIESLRTWYLEPAPSQASSSQLIPLTYAQSSLFREIFDDIVLGGEENSHILIAPDAESMRQLLVEEPGRIGYLPKSWASPPLVEIPLPVSLRRELRLDIVAASASAPDETAQRLIDCLQSGVGQSLLADIYLPFNQ